MYNLDKIFCYINTVFLCEGEVKGVQLLIHEPLSNDIVVETVSFEDLKKLYSENINTKRYCFDFKIENGFLRCSSARALEVDEFSSPRLGVSTTVSQVVTSIYDLFNDLVDCKAKLVSDKVITDNVEDLYDGLATFIPKFSKSTMSVYIPCKVNGAWTTKNLIKMDNGLLCSKPFYFLTSKNVVDLETKYNLKPPRIITLDNEEYKLYRYNGELSLYTALTPDIQLFPSIINKYSCLSELYKQIGNLVALIIKSISVDNSVKDDVAKPIISRKSESEPNVYISIMYKNVTGKELKELFVDIVKNVIPSIKDGNFSNEMFTKYLKDKQYDYIRSVLALEVVKCLTTKNCSNMDMLEMMYKKKDEVLSLKYKIDSFLYKTRANIFTMGYNLGEYNIMVLEGSELPYSSEIRYDSMTQDEIDKRRTNFTGGSTIWSN